MPGVPHLRLRETYEPPTPHAYACREKAHVTVRQSHYPPPDPPITLAGGMAAEAMGFGDQWPDVAGGGRSPLESRSCVALVARRAGHCAPRARASRGSYAWRLYRGGPRFVPSAPYSCYTYIVRALTIKARAVACQEGVPCSLRWHRWHSHVTSMSQAELCYPISTDAKRG